MAEIVRLREQLELDNSYLKEEQEIKGSIAGIIGNSDALRYVISKARQVAANIVHCAADG